MLKVAQDLALLRPPDDLYLDGPIPLHDFTHAPYATTRIGPHAYQRLSIANELRVDVCFS